MKKHIFSLSLILMSIFTSMSAQMSSGYYRVKNAGTGRYSVMESNYYCGISVDNDSKFTNPGTVFYVEASASTTDGGYTYQPLAQLRSQCDDVNDNIAWSKAALQNLDEMYFNVIKSLFTSSSVMDSSDKSNLEAFSYSDFKNWVAGMNPRMRVREVGDGSGSFYNYVACESNPVPSVDTDKMNAVWSSAEMTNLINASYTAFLPQVSEKVLETTVKSMLLEFRFGGNLYLASDEAGEFVFFREDNFSGEVNATWLLEPIDDTNYFAVAPESSNTDRVGNYYITLYTDFAYRLSEGVKAYTIQSVTQNGVVYETEPVEIPGDIVPRFTPVLLKTKSTNASDNKLTPIESSEDQNTLYNTLRVDNLLNYNNSNSKGATSIRNFFPTPFGMNQNGNMRALGINGNGVIGFYTPPTSFVHPVNTAYITYPANDVNIKVVMPDCSAVSGYYRVKNLGSDDGINQYACMESNIYCGTRVNANDKYTKPGTVFYLDVEDQTSETAYPYKYKPVRQLRSQCDNVNDNIAWSKAVVAGLDQPYFEILKNVFLAAPDLTDEEKTLINAYTFAQFREWTAAMNPVMRVREVSEGSHTYYNYVRCEDFPIEGVDVEKMNQAWQNPSLQAQMDDIVDALLPVVPSEYNTLRVTVKEMLHQFRFGGNLYLARNSEGDFVFYREDNFQGVEDAMWELEPIDDENYFAVAPNSALTDNKGHYYCTVFFDFAVKLPSDGSIKAWYIKSVKNNGVEDIAKPVEISGFVPRFTPAIIECESTDAVNNKLMPVEMTAADWTTWNDINSANLLDYNNIRNKTYLTDHAVINFFPQGNYEGPVNDKDNFRVLSIKNGRLGFYVYSGNVFPYNTIPVNRAYLNLNGVTIEAKNIRLDFSEWDETTGIDNINTNSYQDNVIYNLNGQRVSTPTNGLYIINGKKIFIK